MTPDNIILIGFTSSGKTATGQLLAKALDYGFEDLDRLIERRYAENHAESRTCREIFVEHGQDVFRELEHEALFSLCGRSGLVLATGGATPLQEANRTLLRNLGWIVYLKASPEVAYRRMASKGLPAYLNDDPSMPNLRRIWHERNPCYHGMADAVIDVDDPGIDKIVQEILHQIPHGFDSGKGESE